MLSIIIRKKDFLKGLYACFCLRGDNERGEEGQERVKRAGWGPCLVQPDLLPIKKLFCSKIMEEDGG